MNTEEIYEAAFNDELEKIAISQRMLQNAFLKRVSGSKAISDQAKRNTRKGAIQTLKENSSWEKKSFPNPSLSEMKSYLRKRPLRRLLSSEKEILEELKGKKFDAKLDRELRSI